MLWERWLRPFEKTLVILATALGMTAILVQLEFSGLEALFYDFRMAHGWNRPANADIVLVTIDDATIRELGELAPLPLEYHARLLDSLQGYQPRGVGYLVDLNRVLELAPDQFQGQPAQKFLSSARKLEQQGAFLLGSSYDVAGEAVPPIPLNTLPRALAVIHKDGNVFSEDKVTRRALTMLYGKPVFHVAFSHLLGEGPTGLTPRGSFYLPEVDSQFFFFRYHGDTSLRLDGRQAGQKPPYPRFSFAQVLSGKVPADELKNKIILVSTMTRDQSGDFVFTPYSRQPFTHPKIAVHATILDSVMKDEGILRAYPWVTWLTTFAVTALVLWCVLALTPLYGVFAIIGLALAFVGISHALFSGRGLWIRQSQPLVAILISYYLAVPYRLIREYRKRWEFQRKHRLMLQVEEMKTNFLSLVTHDLKTPVARIQGLAETVLRRASARLAQQDVENLRHVVASTDELNRFIGSILELTKVESNRLQLRTESRDINQLIEKAIEGFEAQARMAEIKIVASLEPLFPIRIDTDLISKVLNNLLDNAIKYSPPGSTVTVESREIAESVEIVIRDQGIGMSASETEKLFTRFYRAKNDTTTRVNGTGLGLYLSKYFIEAHGGSIAVESEESCGSAFRIVLPLNFSPPVLQPPVGASQRENKRTVSPGLTTSQWKESQEKSHV